MKSLRILLATALSATAVQASSIVYQGEAGPGVGKHIVFLASDHEYRAEEACPALARILAKRMGFKCTVIFGVDQDGFIEAGSSHISGLAALESADLFFIFTRFLNLPDEEMGHIEAYLTRGGPVVGLRTSSHAFKIPAESKYAKYDFKSTVAGYENGFGHQILGNTWVGHYGRNHVQGTRVVTVPEQRGHVALTGVGDAAFTHAGGYVGIAAPDFTVLATSQPLVSMDPAAEVDASKPPMPCVWTREYAAKDGTKHRVFHSTQGASQDFLDENYRRLILNGVLWAAGMEKDIKADLDCSFVGSYNPSRFSNAGHVKNVKPADLAGWESPIMPVPAD
ncbi:MAG: ThuA domain-containing protein [Akkermansiaceae bacterium]